MNPIFLSIFLLCQALWATTEAHRFLKHHRREQLGGGIISLSPRHHESETNKDGNYPSLSLSSATQSAVLQLRGGVNPEVSDIVVSAYDWCINLGAPSALVAGAVIATIYENIGSGALEVRMDDSKATRLLKRVTRVLLLSAFSLEILAVFVTTVTGTMLLSRTLDFMDEFVPVTAETTPLAFLRNNFEFEYLTARVAFLQGLVNWVSAVALSYLIPSMGVTKKMNKFIGSSLLSLVLLMMAFYNNHMTFYDNYFGMLQHWYEVTIKRFIFTNPPRPMVYVILPSLILSLYLGVQAFFFNSEEGYEFEESRPPAKHRGYSDPGRLSLSNPSWTSPFPNK